MGDRDPNRLGARNNEFIFTSPIAFREAFEASKAEYQAYKRARDKIELGMWQLWHPERLPKPTTIDEIVDQYFETTLGPEVKQKVSLLNGSAKQDAEQTSHRLGPGNCVASLSTTSPSG